MKSSPFRLLFFGSDAFSVRVLDYLLSKRICPIGVVTKCHSQLDRYSCKNKIVRHFWPLDITRSDEFKPFNIGLVASFGELIDPNTVNHFQSGLFNIHPSLLPKYRGSSPIQTAIKDGISETGCSLMRIPPIPKFDIGDIIFQERVTIHDREYAIHLAQRLADIGALMAEKLLLNYDQSMSSSKPQSQEGKSLARRIKPEDGLIRFRSENSYLIDRQVRAYTGFISLFTYCLNGLKVELEELRDPSEIESYNIDRVIKMVSNFKNVIYPDTHPPKGTIFLHKPRNLLCIKCADDRWLSFNYITPESKARMKAPDFYNGYLSKVKQVDRVTDV